MPLNSIDKIIKQQQEEALDVPAISASAVQFLHVMFNASYAAQRGILGDLKRAGYSEAYIAGFLAGLQYCSDTLDAAVDLKNGSKDMYEFS